MTSKISGSALLSIVNNASGISRAVLNILLCMGGLVFFPGISFAEIHIEQPERSFQFEPGDKAIQRDLAFTCKNTGSEPVAITAMESSCSCVTFATLLPLTIEPGGQALLKGEFTLKERKQSAQSLVLVAGSDGSSLKLTVRGHRSAPINALADVVDLLLQKDSFEGVLHLAIDPARYGIALSDVKVTLSGLPVTSQRLLMRSRGDLGSEIVVEFSGPWKQAVTKAEKLSIAVSAAGKRETLFSATIPAAFHRPVETLADFSILRQNGKGEAEFSVFIAGAGTGHNAQPKVSAVRVADVVVDSTVKALKPNLWLLTGRVPNEIVQKGDEKLTCEIVLEGEQTPLRTSILRLWETSRRL